MKRLFPESIRITGALIILLNFFSCTNSDNNPVEQKIESRGALVGSSYLASFQPQAISQIIKSIHGAPEISIPFQFEVDAYKIIYNTTDPKGEIVTASGAVFIPRGKDNLSIISLHHGTQTKRTSVGSVTPLNSIEGVVGASLGYLSLVPDYLGLGESKIVHPYHHQKSSANSVIDFIRAGREFIKTKNIKLNGQVFLAGYSEGGYVTLAAQKEIEKNYRAEINITASAPMSGAYDLYLTTSNVLKNKTYDEPSFLAFLVYAYNSIYGWNKIDKIFNAPYSSKMNALFDGTKSTSEINQQLSNDLSVLLKSDFIKSFFEGKETELINVLKENSLLDWTPAAPIRFFHGSADEYVPYENSVNATAYFKSVGATVDLITIPNGTHETAVLPSILGAIEWFETIRLKKTTYIAKK